VTSTSDRSRQRALRLFVASDLPADARARIAAWQERELAPRGALRINRSLHLTLCFLGSLPAERLAEVESVLAAVAVEPATVAIGDAILLPEHGRKRIVALPLTSAAGAPGGLQRLRDLQGRIAEALTGSGIYQAESRPWLPHLTVARFRRPGHPFSLQNVNFGELLLSRVVLYTSVLDRSGAIHTPLRTYTAR
jgi:2'-5' RNA ligase